MKRVLYLGAVVVLGVALVSIFHRVVFNHVNSFFGFESGQGNDSHYLFWSGAGSNLAYLSVIGGALIYYRKENCKYRWCPFLGHYEFTNPETGVTRKLCALHHPDVRAKWLTREHLQEIQEKRHLYLGDRPGHG